MPFSTGSAMVIFPVAFCIIQALCGSVVSGVEKTEKGINPKVINGREVKQGEIPSMLALYHSNKIFSCGAFLITLQTALTAQHCVHSLKPSDFLGGVGNVNRNKIDKFVHFSAIKGYPGYHSSNISNDIAILILEEKLELSDSVQPIALPRSGRSFNEGSGTLYGWGRFSYETTNTSIKLHATEEKIISLEECRKTFFKSISNSICAGGSSESAPCQSDSGSPLVYSFEGKQIAIGILSFGDRDCKANVLPAVYASVSAYADWIQENSVGDVTFI